VPKATPFNTSHDGNRAIVKGPERPSYAVHQLGRVFGVHLCELVNVVAGAKDLACAGEEDCVDVGCIVHRVECKVELFEHLGVCRICPGSVERDASNSLDRLVDLHEFEWRVCARFNHALTLMPVREVEPRA